MTEASSRTAATDPRKPFWPARLPRELRQQLHLLEERLEEALAAGAQQQAS